MFETEEILRSKIKPKEKQTTLTEAIVSGKSPIGDFVSFFASARSADKGVCADVMKHVSAAEPALLAPFMYILIEFVNYPSPRVKWGVPESIGNLAKDYPETAAKAIPYLLINTTDSE